MPNPKMTLEEQVQRLRLKAIENLAGSFAQDDTNADAITAFGQLCNQAEGGGMRLELDALAQRVRTLEDQQIRVETTPEPGPVMNLG